MRVLSGLRKVVFDALVKLKYKYAIELLENGCVDLSSVAEKDFFLKF